MEAFHRDDPELEALREFGRDDSEWTSYLVIPV